MIWCHFLFVESRSPSKVYLMSMCLVKVDLGRLEGLVNVTARQRSMATGRRWYISKWRWWTEFAMILIDLFMDRSWRKLIFWYHFHFVYTSVKKSSSNVDSQVFLVKTEARQSSVLAKDQMVWWFILELDAQLMKTYTLWCHFQLVSRVEKMLSSDVVMSGHDLGWLVARWMGKVLWPSDVCTCGAALGSPMMSIRQSELLLRMIMTVVRSQVLSNLELLKASRCISKVGFCARNQSEIYHLSNRTAHFLKELKYIIHSIPRATRGWMWNLLALDDQEGEDISEVIP